MTFSIERWSEKRIRKTPEGIPCCSQISATGPDLLKPPHFDVRVFVFNQIPGKQQRLAFSSA